MAEIEWRRKWKPDLLFCSWRQLDLLQEDDDKNRYLMKAKFDDHSYELLITDLTHFWSEKLGGDTLKKRVAKFNPSIEAPLTKILDQIQACLENNRKETKLSVSLKDDNLLLNVISQLAGMPFSFNFNCGCRERDVGRDHLSVPLMSMVGEMYRQQQELFKILTAKDKEIDDYKLQGAKTTRKHIETVPFDAVAFNNCMITSKGFESEVQTYGAHTFTSVGQELYREIANRRAWLASEHDRGAGDDVEDGVETMDGLTNAPSVESWVQRLPTSLAQHSPTKGSPTKSSKASPSSSRGSDYEESPIKDPELLRRQALERKLEQEEAKQTEKVKKKKKLKL